MERQTSGKILTITVPSYNVEQYLNETIPSFLDSRVLDDIEILIINDGSKDKTAEIAEELHNKYPKTIFLVNKENGGHGSTINKGIELANGKYFKVVDGDDWVDTEAFVKFVYMLKKLNSDVVMTPFIMDNEDTGEKTLKTFTGIDFNIEYNFEDVIKILGDQYQMHSTTYKTEVLRKMPKISEHCFYVDQEYIIYPIPHLQTITFLDYAIYQYRIGNVNQSVNMQNQIKNRKMHERVVLNCLDYLLDQYYKENSRAFLEQRVEGLCERQLIIFYAMKPGKETKRELVSFAKEVKSRSSYIYKRIPGKKWRILRWSGFSLYGLLFLGQKQ